MRDASTTALEVAGFLMIAVAVGLLTWGWLGWLLAGLCCVGIGAAEGRK